MNTVKDLSFIFVYLIHVKTSLHELKSHNINTHVEIPEELSL